MKTLFDFRIKKKVTETKKESSKNEKGETVTVEKEVETTTSQVVLIKKPNRSLFDEAELFYGVRLSEGIKAGLLTRALLAKRFSNDGGILSDDDKDRYADLYLKLYEVQLEHDHLAGVGKKKTKAQEVKLADLVEQLGVIKKELTDFEMAQSSLFEQTAENRARNKTILWWTLHLGYLLNDEEDEDAEPIPVFEGDTYEEKLEKYDKMEEDDDEFVEELLSKLLYYVSFWYVGKVNTEEEFKKLLNETERAENLAEESSQQEGVDKKESSDEKTPAPPQKNEKPEAKAKAK